MSDTGAHLLEHPTPPPNATAATQGEEPTAGEGGKPQHESAAEADAEATEAE